MNVIKIGGGVLNCAAHISNLPSALARYEGNHILVVSALGKTTNALEIIARHAWSRETSRSISLFHELLAWHRSVAHDLNVLSAAEKEIIVLQDETDTFLKDTDEYPSLYSEFADRILSMGERLSAALVGALLKDRGIDVIHISAFDIIKTDVTFGAAVPDYSAIKSTSERYLLPLLSRGKTALIEGFIGFSHDQRPTTLGREGSDYTAALLAAVTGVDGVILYKGVPGVLTCDPLLVSKARVIRRLSYQQAQRLFKAGAKVVHPKTIAPLMEHKIPIHIVPYFKTGTGTEIGAECSWSSGSVHALAVRSARKGIILGSLRWLSEPDELSIVTVLGEPPLTADLDRRVSQVLLDAGCLAAFDASGPGSWVGVVPTCDMAHAMVKIHDLIEA